jgi:hypothetical protein
VSEIHFHNNFNDLSSDTAFQFEFYCQHCNDAWRTPPVQYLAGAASGLLGTASSILGGILGGASQAANYVRDAGYKSAHDKAFTQAIEQAQQHFQRCRKCSAYVCAQCYNPELHLCTSCAPSIAEEANAAARETEIEMARSKAQKNVQSGKRKTDNTVTCPSCGARVKPSKFCSECGQPLQTKSECTSCHAEIPPGSKFCPECGAKQ